MENKTFEIITLGCKLNFCESAAIAKSLAENGFSRAAEGEKPDICVINSCAVTGAAAAKTRQAVSRARRDNPEGVVVLCGCYPQSYPEETGLSGGADIVAGNSEKGKIGEIVNEFLKSRVKTVKIAPLSREFDESAAIPDEDRTRAFIKIEDGCDRICSYCIIPTARGRVRSLSPEKITEQAKMCAQNGHKEIVLTGINLSCYGQELGLTLADGLIAAAKSEIPRIRLSSLEPDMITDEEIEKMLSVKQLCPHFHLCLQSGSDSVLKRMNRRYNTGQYRLAADKLRQAFPECSITTDIIVGFPGETDEEFEQTVQFAREIGFAKIHIFPYSIREGTVAAEMPQVNSAVRRSRVRRLTEESKLLERQFYESRIGGVCGVLIEKPRSESYSVGFTENYVPVRIYGKPLLRHSIVKVKLTKCGGDYCVGTLV